MLPIRGKSDFRMMWVFLCALLGTLAQMQEPPLLIASASSVLVDSAVPRTTVTLLSGLHYDAFFGKPGGYGVCNQEQFSMVTPGCDSSLKLISSVLRDVMKWKGNFTFITGGLLRHGTDSITLHENYIALGKVLDEIALAATNYAEGKKGVKYSTQLSLGGTEFFPTDTFKPDVKNELFMDLLYLLRAKGFLSPEEGNDMSDCGFYYRDLVGVKLRVISLNTLLWSTALLPPLGVGDIDPCGQFPFLQSAIEQAKNRDRSVIILGDTPPVLNIADALRKESVQDAGFYWREDFRDAYFRIIANYRFTVSAQFFGHTSCFSFVTSSELGPPMFIVPSISPVMGTNPSYIRVTLENKTGRVVSVRQRYLGANDTWVEGEALENIIQVPLRQINEFSPKDYLQIVQDTTRWERFAAMQVGGRFLMERKTCGVWCRRVITCASLYYEKNAIDLCSSLNLPLQRDGLILAIVFTSIAVLSIVVAFSYIVMNQEVLLGVLVVRDAGKVRRRLLSSCTEEIYT